MLAWFPSKQRADDLPPTVLRGRQTAAAVAALARQDNGEASAVRDRWTEADVKGLPAGEHDYFDRKSGAIFDDTEKLKGTLAKALSAFANSGGGSLVLGVKDDGTFDGVPLLRGSASTRESLEQLIPNLVSYPLSSFRVHAVEPDAHSSDIPADRGLVVVDVGDSPLAPHQCAFSGGQAVRGIYYQRQGGHSVPAPHFYIELLRQRLTSPILRFEVNGVRLTRTGEPVTGGLFVAMTLDGTVRNQGRIAAYKWGLQGRWIIDGDMPGEFFADETKFPIRTGESGIDISDRTILPGGEKGESLAFGVTLPAASNMAVTRAQLEACIRALSLEYRLATESGLSDYETVAVSTAPNFPALIERFPH
jgi:hypothetical protein